MPYNVETARFDGSDGPRARYANAREGPVDLSPPTVIIRGESTWIGHDPDTGEKAIILPGPKGFQAGAVLITLR